MVTVWKQRHINRAITRCVRDGGAALELVPTSLPEEEEVVNLVSLFQNASNKETFTAGSTLFKEGETGNVMYVIINGQIDINVGRFTVATAGPGELVGEMALIDAQSRSATAIAKTACEVAPVDERQFTFLVQEHPLFALHVMRTVVSRLRHMNQHLVTV